MSDGETPEPQGKWTYHLDRPSARTDEEREAAFERYLETSVPYFEAVEANGGTPWFKIAR
jgi:hypothetical protein